MLVLSCVMRIRCAPGQGQQADVPTRNKYGIDSFYWQSTWTAHEMYRIHVDQISPCTAQAFVYAHHASFLGACPLIAKKSISTRRVFFLVERTSQGRLLK